MARRLLFSALVMSTYSGCIVPTPLAQEEPASMFPAPLIVTDGPSATTPPVGFLTLPVVAGQETSIEVKVVAEHANPNLKQLFATLYHQTTPSTPRLALTGPSIPLTPSGAKFQFSGTFPPAAYCGFFRQTGTNDGGLLWLQVAATNVTPPDVNQTDSVSWKLVCPGS